MNESEIGSRLKGSVHLDLSKFPTGDIFFSFYIEFLGKSLFSLFFFFRDLHQ